MLLSRLPWSVSQSRRTRLTDRLMAAFQQLCFAVSPAQLRQPSALGLVRIKHQVLIVPAEVGGRRDRLHRDAVYLAVRIDRKGDIGRLHPVELRVGLERVILIMS